MSLLEQDETVATVLSEQLERIRATIKKAEWAAGENGDCPWCSADPYEGHALECDAFTASGIPK